MTFPSVELKFSRIVRSSEGVSLTVRLYRLDDGGMSVPPFPHIPSTQVVLRTLLAERQVMLPPHVTRAQVLAEGRTRLQEWALEKGYNLPEDRRICTLT